MNDLGALAPPGLIDDPHDADGGVGRRAAQLGEKGGGEGRQTALGRGIRGEESVTHGHSAALLAGRNWPGSGQWFAAPLAAAQIG
jgi:hypothetical protein